MYFSVFIKYVVICILSILLTIGLMMGWGSRKVYHQTPQTFASQEGLSPGEYCDKYQYSSLRHQEIKTKITTLIARIVNAFDLKYDPQTKINKYAVIVSKLNGKMLNTNSKMILYVGNCAKNLVLQQILKNRSLMQNDDRGFVDEITQIFLDEYNGKTFHYAPNRSILGTLSQGTGAYTGSNSTRQQSISNNPGLFGTIYLNASNVSLQK